MSAFHRQSKSQNGTSMPPSALSGILQAAQALGSIGAPKGSLENASSSTTTAGTDTLHNSAESSSFSPAGGYTTGIANQNHQATKPGGAASGNASSVTMSQTPQFDTQRRLQNYGRHPDELHMNASGPGPSQRGTQMSPRDQQSSGAPPRIALEHATMEGSQYTNNPPTLSSNSRPGTMGGNPAPYSVPTLQQGSSYQQDPYSTPLRAATVTQSHTKSRSSPQVGYDQAYTPRTLGEGGGDSQFTSPTNQRYIPQSQQRNVSNTPLGLADIRPRADSSLEAGLPGANPYSYDGNASIPTNSNYLAPWAIYAFDWCKWPAAGSDAGKLAAGSYLEDGHNFVRTLFLELPS